LCCGEREISLLGEWECGHIIASSMGGLTTINNLRPLCGSCNRSMGIENMKTYMERTGRDKSNPEGYLSLCVEWVTPDEYKNAMDVNSDEGNGEDERQSIRYVDMVKEDPKV
jgi:HNH endonuclease